MQRSNIVIFVIIIGLSGYVNFSFSLPGDFNFNGSIQKVNYLYFNSYFTGREQPFVPNPNDHNSTDIPKSLIQNPNDTNSTKIPEPSAVRSPERADKDDDSDSDNQVGDNKETLRSDTDVSEESSGFTLTDDDEQSILYSGLPVDYSFNESLAEGDNPNKQISAPGCPASGGKDDIEYYLYSNRSVWVHHGNPPRCYLVGSPGPCGEGMSLGLQSGSFVGKCKCKCFVEFTKLEYLQTVKEHDLSNLDPFLDEKQSFCFDYDEGHFALYEGKCHKLLTQGPCKNNEAFVLNKITNKPSCEVRECPEAEKDETRSLQIGYAIKHNGICTKLRDECVNYTSAGANTNDGLNSKNYVGTKVDNPMPSCVTEEEGVEFGTRPYLQAFGLQPSNCAEINQSFSKILRRCVPYNSRGRSGGVG